MSIATPSVAVGEGAAANALPDIILQMQRMGDIILTFPLLIWLQAQEPQRPRWVVAEQRFFTDLMDLAPSVTFFPHEAEKNLCSAHYNRVINASHRDKGIRLAGALACVQRYGAYERDNSVHIQGDWMLYRASIVENNRHNRFHWSDLYALDSVQRSIIQQSVWPQARPANTGKTGRIGLFVGASESAKHPSAEFWTDLAGRLLHFGLKPVLLGGTADKPLAAEIERRMQTRGLNLAGRFTLSELAECMRDLDLLISPDTGPMHLAAWVGTQVLNLSMGNVNPWETSPMQPGHYVVSSTLSCQACWHCTQKTLRCHRAFTPQNIASIARAIIKKPENLAHLRLHGLVLHQTARDSNGLHTLHMLGTQKTRLRDSLGDFWRQIFWGLLEDQPAACSVAWEQLVSQSDCTSQLREALTRMQKSLTPHIRKNTLPDASFWKKNPPLLRPLSGYINLLCYNEMDSEQAWQRILGLLEKMSACIH